CGRNGACRWCCLHAAPAYPAECRLRGGLDGQDHLHRCHRRARPDRRADPWHDPVLRAATVIGRLRQPVPRDPWWRGDLDGPAGTARVVGPTHIEVPNGAVRNPAKASSPAARRTGSPDSRDDGMTPEVLFESPEDVLARLRTEAYLADPKIGLTVFLAQRLEKPILVEGPAGVGKTELARSVA